MIGKVLLWDSKGEMVDDCLFGFERRVTHVAKMGSDRVLCSSREKWLVAKFFDESSSGMEDFFDSQPKVDQSCVFSVNGNRVFKRGRTFAMFRRSVEEKNMGSIVSIS